MPALVCDVCFSFVLFSSIPFKFLTRVGLGADLERSGAWWVGARILSAPAGSADEGTAGLGLWSGPPDSTQSLADPGGKAGRLADFFSAHHPPSEQPFKFVFDNVSG